MSHLVDLFDGSPRSIRACVGVSTIGNGTRPTSAAYTRSAAESAMAVGRRFRGDAFSSEPVAVGGQVSMQVRSRPMTGAAHRPQLGAVIRHVAVSLLVACVAPAFLFYVTFRVADVWT